MNDKKYLRKTKIPNIIFFLYSLSGCKYNNFNPSSLIVEDQINLIFIAFFLMLFVVIPAIFMSLYFSWKYKEKNKNKNYNPNFLHSKKIELIIWTFPILIIFILSIITWYSTHKMDPYKTNYFNNKIKPINIEVVSFDWKWLFIYPERNIAMINQLVFPVNTPIIFNITSNTVMNSFFIPMLSSQIYAMAGMKTKLNLIANKSGNLSGISSNFSGKGFNGMKFKVIVTKDRFDFEKWIQKAKKSHKKINTIKEYQNISKPTINNPIELFSNVDLDIFNKIIKSKINNKTIDLPEK